MYLPERLFEAVTRRGHGWAWHSLGEPDFLNRVTAAGRHGDRGALDAESQFRSLLENPATMQISVTSRTGELDGRITTDIDMIGGVSFEY